MSKAMQVTAIIAAGGRGRRFGGEQLKQLLPVGGRPILERSVSAFLAHPDVHEVIVALPASLIEHPPAYLRQTSKPMRMVSGGARRQESVANAFQAAAVSSDVIVIHDAARPFASADLIARTIAAAAESGAALAALASRDTVKRASDAPDRGASAGRYRTVAETLPRETIFLAQTPQAFRRDVLRAALALGERDPRDATDEAALAERAGHLVRLVDGEASNIKITTREDLVLAEALARSADSLPPPLASEDVRERRLGSPKRLRREGGAFRPSAPTRTGRAGTGYDLHRLVEGWPLILGGIMIPSARGALGHSDADVVCHAVTDAILGAACLGDIGRHFPDSDPRWQGASSLDVLSRAVALVTAEGLEVGNVDVTVILEAPRIRDHVDAMRAAVARAIGIDPARVSVKGKTNEGVDAIGRGEAIAAHAIALLRSRA
ncbi:MAG: 2-C-methyl-D-erythritol 4-phosphate cytidylyltransferase [Acidobacteria bacterium]|nr:2-C-methyl-D-erythritol 4-phosphate cytidylyltransferase [Acidobacteriota bacterium]